MWSCVENAITLGIHGHTSTMNASGHSTGSASSACMHAHVVPIFTSHDVPLAVSHHTDRV